MEVLQGWVRRLGATRAELVGLCVLLVGGLAVLGLLLVWRPPPPSTGAAATGPREPGVLEPSVVTVHVSGAVARPGIVELAGGARVHDAIAAAGGAGPEADLAALNLARVVDDGEQVHVPLVGENAAAGGGRRADGRIDLNRASAEELQALPGIGPALAQRIVAWREEHGPFTSAGQLREVSGIGERVFQGLADLVVPP